MSKLDDLLALRGAKRLGNGGDKALAKARADHTHFLAHHYLAFDSLRSHLLHPDKHPHFKSTFASLKVLDFLKSHHWVRQLDGNTCQLICDQETRVWLAGGWLEEYVYLAFEACGVEEAYFGQKIEWTVNNTTGNNEIDVLARRGDVLAFVSCKTMAPQKSGGHMSDMRDFLTETDYWNIHFAANEGRALLVVTADLVDEHRKALRYPQIHGRADVQEVTLAGIEDLHWEKLLQVIVRLWAPRPKLALSEDQLQHVS